MQELDDMGLPRGTAVAGRTTTKSASDLEAPTGRHPHWTTMDVLLRSIELHELFAQLGLRPPIWHMTDRFTNRIESSIGEANIEWAWSCARGEVDEDSQILSLHDPEGFLQVAQEAESFLERRAKEARNTEEFDEVIHRLRMVRKPLVDQEPVRGSAITDLLCGLWLGRNWDRLPEELDKQRKALDGVLQDICLAIERPTVAGFNSRPLSLSKAANAYIENDWMHTKWLTTQISRVMLADLGSTMEKSSKSYFKGTLMSLAAGLAVGRLWDRAVGIMLGAAGLWALAMGFWTSYTAVEIEQIGDALQSGNYDGGVLTDRLERLNRRFGCQIPSVLTGVLRAQPAQRNSKVAAAS